MVPRGSGVHRGADLARDRGIAALIDRTRVAVFRLSDGQVSSVGDYDPRGAHVMSRGWLGSTQRGNAPDGAVSEACVSTVALSVSKQAFDLRDGRRLSIPEGSIGGWEGAIDDARVRVRAKSHPAGYPQVGGDE